MKFYQKVLIGTHSRLDGIGFFSNRGGLLIYSKIYFLYKRYLEGRQLVAQLKYLEKHLDFSSTKLVVDVGSHIGFFTREALRVFPHAKVIAVEPPGRNTMSFRVLNAKFIESGMVELMNFAAWSFNGEIPFEFEPSNTANNRFNFNSTTFVPCITVDTITNQIPEMTLILKIDVQGFEFEVLEGAIGTFQRHRVALLIELDESALKARGKTSLSLLEKLNQLGFRPIGMKDGKLTDMNKIQALLSRAGCVDLLFISKL